MTRLFPLRWWISATIVMAAGLFSGWMNWTDRNPYVALAVAWVGLTVTFDMMFREISECDTRKDEAK